MSRRCTCRVLIPLQEFSTSGAEPCQRPARPVQRSVGLSAFSHLCRGTGSVTQKGCIKKIKKSFISQSSVHTSGHEHRVADSRGVNILLYPFIWLSNARDMESRRNSMTATLCGINQCTNVIRTTCIVGTRGSGRVCVCSSRVHESPEPRTKYNTQSATWRGYPALSNGVEEPAVLRSRVIVALVKGQLDPFYS